MPTSSPVGRSAFTFAFALMCISGLVSYFLPSCRRVIEDSEMCARSCTPAPLLDRTYWWVAKFLTGHPLTLNRVGIPIST
ncbi:hypothetical protein B0H14DRAFT_229862 [Mycena olivaceomarginata]|nr:hypothetical protein B0H14DRAFT_229862 [Mycena olivaceomarginata]